jgi:hypothetical protein
VVRRVVAEGVVAVRVVRTGARVLDVVQPDEVGVPDVVGVVLRADLALVGVEGVLVVLGVEVDVVVAGNGSTGMSARLMTSLIRG